MAMQNEIDNLCATITDLKNEVKALKKCLNRLKRWEIITYVYVGIASVLFGVIFKILYDFIIGGR